jgi:hypothetical protein
MTAGELFSKAYVWFFIGIIVGAPVPFAVGMKLERDSKNNTCPGTIDNFVNRCRAQEAIPDLYLKDGDYFPRCFKTQSIDIKIEGYTK